MSPLFKAPDAGPPPTLDTVAARELGVILGSDDPAAIAEARKSLWGLALSGGGIRSATFAIGLLRALAEGKALGGFHYLSTVSGGGYAGAFLQGAIRRYGLDGAVRLLTASVGDTAAVEAPVAAPVQHDGAQPDASRPAAAGPIAANRPVRHLREYSNYLSPRKSALSGDTAGMIATYLRNVLLTQSQLIALMLALGALPLVAYPLLSWLVANPIGALRLAALVAVTASVVLAWISAQAQRHAQSSGYEAPRPAIAFAALLAVLLLACASGLGAIGIFNYEFVDVEPSVCARMGWDARLSDCSRIDLGLYAALMYTLVWLGWCAFAIGSSALSGKTSPVREHWRRFLIGSLGAGVVAGALVMLVDWIAAGVGHDSTWVPLIFGAPIVLTAVAAAAAVHVGLVGRALSDLQREVWARIGGRSGVAVFVGMSASLGLLLFGPWLFANVLSEGEHWEGRMAALGSVASWIGVSLSGVLASARSGQTRGNEGAIGMARRLLIAIAPWVFVLGLWVGIGLLVQALLRAMGVDGVPAFDHAASFWLYLHALSQLAGEHRAQIWTLFLAALALWAILGLATDANELSLNAFYRNRLVRCYLGATNAARNAEPVTNFDPHDDLPLDDLCRGGGRRPLYPLICAAMNLVSAKQLDWQDRRAASFVLSPEYCGYLPPQGRAGAEPAGDRSVPTGDDALAKRLQLGTAIAASGAAVSPNMGARISPAITFLLALFDARLGWWLPNRMRQGRMPSDSPRFPGLNLLRELLGLTHGAGRFAHVSDGGHFENLGIYELVRRRCRFILCSDAGADSRREFADLGNAIQKCRIDFGAQIVIDVSELRPDPVTGLSRRHATVGKIRYADGSEGLLLYLKPSLLGDEPADIQHYARMHPEFPHEPTSDQYFDEAQFECYRRLGEHIGESILARIGQSAEEGVDLGEEPRALDLETSEYKEHLLREATHQFYEPVDAIGRNFSRHSEAVADIFKTLRATPALTVLDAQLYPGWVHVRRRGHPHPPPAAHASDASAAAVDAAVTAAAAETPVHLRLPAPADFRACFYFCQELLRLMEAVYFDLDLENNWNHPDNRGWMNLFRHWSWVPTFRICWALSAQTSGARFVGFCESRVGIPRIDQSLKVDGYRREVGESIGDFAARLRDLGLINFVEASILKSKPLSDSGDIDEVFVLSLRWDRMLPKGHDLERNLPLGIAAKAGERLILFRVQDHVRRLGLGHEFMRLLMDQRRISAVTIAPGYYGDAGVLHRSESNQLQQQLERMRAETQLRRRADTRAAEVRQAVNDSSSKNPRPAAS